MRVGKNSCRHFATAECAQRGSLRWSPGAQRSSPAYSEKTAAQRRLAGPSAMLARSCLPPRSLPHRGPRLVDVPLGRSAGGRPPPPPDGVISDAALYAVDGGVATITLNRPANKNRCRSSWSTRWATGCRRRKTTTPCVLSKADERGQHLLRGRRPQDEIGGAAAPHARRHPRRDHRLAEAGGRPHRRPGSTAAASGWRRRATSRSSPTTR